jgi:hypothetical protein
VSARAEAKRHIYRCLATTLANDVDLGAGYLRELTGDDPEDDFLPGMYEGPKLRKETCDKLIKEIVDELNRRGGR